MALASSLGENGGAGQDADRGGMRAVVQQEDAHSYSGRGQVITRGLLSPLEVRRVAARLRGLLLENGRRAFGGKEGEKEVRFTFAVHELDAVVAGFVGNQSGLLWQAARELTGGQKELCLLMDRGFSKDPGDPETHWHRDDEAIGLPAVHPDLRTVHAWIPLAAMGSELGTLRYVVGTHRRSFGWFEKLLASLWGWEFAWFMTAPIVQDESLELGDVAWHDGWVLHSAGGNAKDSVRDGLAVSFAYCSSASGCGGKADRVSASDGACKVVDSLFDKTWRARHRSGENDYAKTAIKEPFVYQAARFTWRSVFGALAGLAIHALTVGGLCRKQKES